LDGVWMASCSRRREQPPVLSNDEALMPYYALIN
jgi:hypothetical protein